MTSIPFVPQRRMSPVAVGGDGAQSDAAGGRDDNGNGADRDPADWDGALGNGAEWDDFGPLAPYLADPAVTDLFVNGVDGLWVDDGTGLRQLRGAGDEPGEGFADDFGEPFDEGLDGAPDVSARGNDLDGSEGAGGLDDERALRALAVRLIALGGRHIDETSPCVDVRLRDGIRVHAVLPPISTTGTLLSIRIPRRERFRLADLAASGMVSGAQSERLRLAIRRRENILVTGAAGTGKTTLLAALLAEAPPGERIVAIEDVAELRVEHPHFVSLESRQANLEGAGEIGMERLVREALRMRPDRLVLGECRGAEIRELLAALNTGHDGGAGTLHANSLVDVPARVEALGALAQMTQEAVARQTVSAIGVILHVERKAGIRRLAGVGRFALDARGRLQVVDE